MSKEDNYEVTAREDVTADIPVANVPEGAENALLPKKESEDDDQMCIRDRRVVDPALTFYGRIAELDLDIYTYDEWFLNDEGDEEAMIPAGTCLLYTSYESWGIKYDKIFGDLEKEETWDLLENYLDKEFYFASGSSLLIACTCIDTGGHFTTQCYKWLKKMERKSKRIYGVKGMGGPGIPLIHKLSTNNQLKVKVFILGVDSGKEILMTRLNTVDEGPGYCHFPINADRGYNETYIKGLNLSLIHILSKTIKELWNWGLYLMIEFDGMSRPEITKILSISTEKNINPNNDTRTVSYTHLFLRLFRGTCSPITVICLPTR